MVWLLGKPKPNCKVLAQIGIILKDDVINVVTLINTMEKPISLPSIFIDRYLLHNLVSMKEKTSKLDSVLFVQF